MSEENKHPRLFRLNSNHFSKLGEGQLILPAGSIGVVTLAPDFPGAKVLVDFDMGNWTYRTYLKPGAQGEYVE